MNNLWLSPPVVFVILFVVSIVLSYFSSLLAYRRKGPLGALLKSYTGGEEVLTNRIRPDYDQFFPFAFFFTILHVVTLIVATVPTETWGSFVIATVYVLGAILGLYILFRKDS